jgi:hypothetical protein
VGQVGIEPTTKGPRVTLSGYHPVSETSSKVPQPREQPNEKTINKSRNAVGGPRDHMTCFTGTSVSVSQLIECVFHRFKDASLIKPSVVPMVLASDALVPGMGEFGVEGPRRQ